MSSLVVVTNKRKQNVFVFSSLCVQGLATATPTTALRSGAESSSQKHDTQV